MSSFGSSRSRVRAFTWLALPSALGLLECRREPEPERASAAQVSAPAPSIAATDRAEPPPARPPASPSQAASDSLALDSAVQPSSTLQAGKLNQWLEASLYRFKVGSIRRCVAPVAAASVSAEGGELRISVSVSITAKVDLLLASPRDLNLERDGVILQAELQPSPVCGAPLPTKQLRRGETATGAVNFVLPSPDFEKRLKLHFSPTRWGGAPATTVELPDCLADCAGASANAR